MIYTIHKLAGAWRLYRVDGAALYLIATYKKRNEATLAAHLLAGWRGKVV